MSVPKLVSSHASGLDKAKVKETGRSYLPRKGNTHQGGYAGHRFGTRLVNLHMAETEEEKRGNQVTQERRPYRRVFVGPYGSGGSNVGLQINKDFLRGTVDHSSTMKFINTFHGKTFQLKYFHFNTLFQVEVNPPGIKIRYNLHLLLLDLNMELLRQH